MSISAFSRVNAIAMFFSIWYVILDLCILPSKYLGVSENKAELNTQYKTTLSLTSSIEVGVHHYRTLFKSETSHTYL